MAGVGPDDDPTLASTIRLFGSSEALNWVDHHLSPTDPGAEDTAERLWQHDGAFYRVLDPGWSDPKQRFTRTIRLMDTACIHVQALGDGAVGTLLWRWASPPNWIPYICVNGAEKLGHWGAGIVSHLPDDRGP